VTYTYDSLNRMVAATSKIGQTVDWGQSYTYDPFGNLYEKTVTGGSGPSLSVTVNSATNQIAGSYDANGNALYNNATVYDVENHLSGAGWINGAPAINYGYDGQGKRFFMWPAGAVDAYSNATYSVVAYSPSGQKLGIYQIFSCNHSNSNQLALTLCSTLSTSDQYFGGRRLASMDQLGSVGTYYPWGEAKGTTNPQDTWSYATYWRDSVSTLDYANNRYYTNAYGRFMTPDPYGNSGRLTDPQSWNRYAYTRGDPVNRYDPSGTDDSAPYLCPVGAGEGNTELVECFDVTAPLPSAIGSGTSYVAKVAAIAAYQAAMVALSAMWDKTHSDLTTAAAFIASDAAGMEALPGCEKDIQTLNQETRSDVTFAEIAFQAGHTNFNDALTSGYAPPGFVGPPTPAFYSSDWPAGGYTYAISYLNTNQEYWLPGSTMYTPNSVMSGLTPVAMTPGRLDGMVMHELLHNMGFNDDQLQSATGIIDPLTTDTISQQLSKDCFPSQ
jgi:RHS repeat-associated protein